MGKITAWVAVATTVVTVVVSMMVTIMVCMEAPYASVDISGRINDTGGVATTAKFDVTGGVEMLDLTTPENVTVEGDRITIKYDNPDAVLAGGSVSEFVPNARELQTSRAIYSELRADGFTDAAACAVIGNLQQESSLNPTAVNPSSGASGIGQWTGGRLDNLKQIAENMGTTWKDPEAQAKMVLREIKSEGTWIACLNDCHSTGYSGNFCETYKSTINHQGYTFEQFKKMTNIEDATIMFACHYERAGEAEMMMDTRLSYARGYYAVIGSGQVGVKATIYGTIDRNEIVEIPGSNERAWKCTFKGTVNGWPIKTEGYAKRREATQSGGQVSIIEISTQGYFGVKFGGGTGNMGIVETALAELGNSGGQPYINWYYDCDHERVAWCAIFVSWVAEQNGYIEAGIMPKDAGCGGMMNWYKERDQFMPRSYTPKPGEVIFFDWADDDGGYGDGPDHVGFVEYVENGRIHTLEGNSGDSVRQLSYPADSMVIMGYGCPRY